MSKITSTEVNHLLRTRRSTYPNDFDSKKVEREILESILQNALWAPTHKKTEPWRFVVFQKDNLNTFSQEMMDAYKRYFPKEKWNERKMKKIESNPLKAGAIIAIVLVRHENLIVEWEEIAAAAMSVQNIYLSCKAYDLVGYWSTPSFRVEMRDFLQLKENEKSLGFFYLGHPKEGLIEAPRERKSLDEKVRWA